MYWEENAKNVYGDLEHAKKCMGYLTAIIFLFKTETKVALAVRDMSPDIRLRNGDNWRAMYGTGDFAWISLITPKMDF